MKNFKFIKCAFLAVFILGACSREPIVNSEPVESSVNLKYAESFTTHASYKIDNGVLEFPTFNDMDLFLSDINKSDPKVLSEWEDQNGFYSQRRMFFEVMNAEDELDDYLYSLSEHEQQAKLEEGEYYSDELNQRLESGLIKFYRSPEDGSEYWDYTLIDPGVAGAVDLNGVVKVEGKIVKYSNHEFIYAAHDGDPANLALAESKKEAYDDGIASAYKMPPYEPEGTVDPDDPSDPGADPRSHCSADGMHTVNYTKTNSWKYPTNKKRLKAWVNGKATANFGLPCRYGTTCTFQLRTQAQKKNFWGKWRYKSSWGPTCHVDDADWDYSVEFIEPAGVCSSDVTSTLTNFISGGSNPKPVWDKFIPWTNNGFFGMHPHTSGWWLFYQGIDPQTGSKRKKYICRTIDISYDIPVYYYTYGPSTWNLTN